MWEGQELIFNGTLSALRSIPKLGHLMAIEGLLQELKGSVVWAL